MRAYGAARRRATFETEVYEASDVKTVVITLVRAPRLMLRIASRYNNIIYVITIVCLNNLINSLSGARVVLGLSYTPFMGYNLACV